MACCPTHLPTPPCRVAAAEGSRAASAHGRRAGKNHTANLGPSQRDSHQGSRASFSNLHNRRKCGQNPAMDTKKCLTRNIVGLAAVILLGVPSLSMNAAE